MDEPRDERHVESRRSTSWTGSEDPTAAKIMFVVLAAGALGFLVVGMAIL